MIIIVQTSLSQPGLHKMKANLDSKKNMADSSVKMETNSYNPNQASVILKQANISAGNIRQWLGGQLDFREGTDDLAIKGQPTTYRGNLLQKFQQYYKGIKVEHGIVTAISKNDKAAMLQMEFYSIPDSLSNIPSISETQAKEKAIAYIGATKYIWQTADSFSASFYPHGELVIIEDFIHEKGKLCLAYKFDIFATQPLSRDMVYVNAQNGQVLLKDAIIKHADKKSSLPDNFFFGRNFEESKGILDIGQAETLYSGQQTILAESFAGGFKLQETRDNTVIHTRNMHNNGLNSSTWNELLGYSTEFTDNDNNWGGAEHIANNDIAAHDAHWAMEVIIDYWNNRHDRSSFDNQNGTISNLVHAGTGGSPLNNARWLGKLNSEGFIAYGDGTGGNLPWTSLDLCGHEFGHGVCADIAGLVYERESGALNEGFSDIWGACVENYAKTVGFYGNLGTTKDTWKIGEEFTTPVGTGLRSMSAPKTLGQPDTYKELPFWTDASYEGCPVPDGSPGGNDNCGVHTNSGVLNKWFYLLTQGGFGTNGNNEAFDIASMGFDRSSELAYLTEQVLTPNSGFETARIASVNAAKVLGWTNVEIINLKDAWDAVGVHADTLYSMSNTPVFTTNNFTTIGVGKYGHIWAGTANQGLYKYNGRTWIKTTALTNHNIADIKTDKEGGVWIAQYGSGGAQATGGGVNYFPDSTTIGSSFFSTSAGLPTRNVRSLYVNNFAVNNAYPWNRIWTACYAHITGSVSSSGGVGRGTNFASPQFTKITTGVDISLGSGGTFIMGGSQNEIWAFATANFGHSQILRYNAGTNTFISAIDETTPGSILPAGFTVKAIYYDSVSQVWWIGTQTNGVYICGPDGTNWQQLNFPAIFPAASFVNNNAITGDRLGNVYLGTTAGYIVFTKKFTGSFPSVDENLYRRYTTADGLPSNNIKGICVDTTGNRVLLATDNGIAFRYVTDEIVFSINAGDWNDGNTWSNGKKPDKESKVRVTHPVTINTAAQCKRLYVSGGGSITVAAGASLSISGQSYNIASD